MELLVALVVLIAVIVGALLGSWMRHPLLDERDRVLKQRERRVEEMLAKAQLHEDMAEDKLRIDQAVRAQISQMIGELQKLPLFERPTALEPSPIFEGMHGWLASTGAMPVVEPTVEPAKPKAKRKVSVKVGADVRSELIEVTS
jgi:hypothetical protein